MGENSPGEQAGDGDPLDAVPREAFAALADVHRRHALYYLRDREEASLETLTRVVAGWIGADGDAELTTAAAFDRLRIRLHHLHLPKLDAAGLLSYDADARHATLRSLPGPIDALLDRTVELEPGSPAAADEAPAAGRPPLDGLTRVAPSVRTAADVTSLRSLLARVEERAITVTVFAPAPDEALVEQLADWNVDVEHEPLPATPDGGFALVQQDDVVLGAIGLDTISEGQAGSTAPPWESRDAREAYRSFLGLFQGTTFTTDSRRELLATTREIEDRAWRTGRGTLRAGFQSLSAFESQVPVYETLATETDLDVHVYGRPDWTPPPIEALRIHEESEGRDIGRVWFVVFRDPGGDNSCALVAEERAPDEYTGFWTYDEKFVGAVDDYLAETY